MNFAPTSAITPAQAAQMLAATLPMLKAEVMALPNEMLVDRPSPGEWSINEVIGHLIETEERGFAGRMQRMLAQENYILCSYSAKANPARNDSPNGA